MKIGYSWLKEYIDFDLSPADISNKLTLAGLEVENLEGKDQTDAVMEINVTPNRPDCLSLIGIAREVSALTGCPVKYPDAMVIEEGKDINELTSVTIEDEKMCPRYSARIIQGIKVGPSPKWLKDKLHIAGIRSINNIVDITNFVLMEYGHPLHAFDYDLLKENRIVVRRGIKGERFVALDNTTCDLNDTMLVIADGKKPVAIAGVIGGKNTEVSDKTTNILLESAYFEPTQIRRTSKKIGIQTESSYRFERGADPEGIVKASNRATGLIIKLAGGKSAKGLIDIYPSHLLSPEITLRLDRINKILGTNLSERQANDYMDKLGFSVLPDTKGNYRVRVSSFRRDITREIDLIEEVARLHGYDNIDVENPRYITKRVSLNKFYLFEKEVKSFFKGKGFCEAINYSFISSSMQNLFQNNNKKLNSDNILIQNPISNEWQIMRGNLIPGLLAALQRNLNKGIEDVQFFEVGKQYNAIKKDIASLNDTVKMKNQNQPSKEVRFLAGIVTAKTEKKMWEAGTEERDIYYLKGIIETFLDNMRLKEYNFKRSFLSAFDNSIEIYNDKNKIGVLGEISHKVSKIFGIKERILAFEINLDILYENQGETTKYQHVAKFPVILRDIAVLANREIQSKEIEDFIRQEGTPLLKEMRLFDCYEGKSVPQGKKSLAYSLIFRDDNRTLKDEEVDIIYENIISGLAGKFNVHLRPQ